MEAHDSPSVLAATPDAPHSGGVNRCGSGSGEDRRGSGPFRRGAIESGGLLGIGPSNLQPRLITLDREEQPARNAGWSGHRPGMKSIVMDSARRSGTHAVDGAE
eukprot:469721-Pelagomonas_calceolata.AAC.3